MGKWNKSKAKDIEKDIEAEAGLATVETAPAVTDAGADKPHKANQFSDEYTLEVIADYDPSADIFRIPKKDPSFAYRFIKAEQENMSIKTGNLLYQQGGWQVVPREHLLRIGIAKSFISPDGSYHVGETVLAFMPKELFEKKEAAKVKKANARMEEISRKLKRGDPTVGGKEMHSTMRGIEPGHKLGMSTKESED